jgi:hypothetical protein
LTVKPYSLDVEFRLAQLVLQDEKQPQLESVYRPQTAVIDYVAAVWGSLLLELKHILVVAHEFSFELKAFLARFVELTFW